MPIRKRVKSVSFLSMQQIISILYQYIDAGATIFVGISYKKSIDLVKIYMHISLLFTVLHGIMTLNGLVTANDPSDIIFLLIR